MGFGLIGEAVVDAGPIIHLDELGRLHLLQIFDRLHVPQAVWDETVEMQRVGEDRMSSLRELQRHKLKRDDLKKFIWLNDYEMLQPGECECLFLCSTLRINTLLTDDLAVRAAAHRQGCTPVGSLGIVVKAYHLGLLTLAEADECLLGLYDRSSLFVTRELVVLAMEQMRS